MKWFLGISIVGLVLIGAGCAKISSTTTNDTTAADQLKPTKKAYTTITAVTGDITQDRFFVGEESQSGFTIKIEATLSSTHEIRSVNTASIMFDPIQTVGSCEVSGRKSDVERYVDGQAQKATMIFTVDCISGSTEPMAATEITRTFTFEPYVLYANNTTTRRTLTVTVDGEKVLANDPSAVTITGWDTAF